MNLEDKYKKHFKKQETEVNPKQWELLSNRLDGNKNKPKQIWVIAACLAIGLILIKHNYSTPKIQQLTTKVKVQNKQPSVQNKIQIPEVAIKKPIVNTKHKIRSKESSISLQTIALNNINTPTLIASIKRENITFVQLNIKSQNENPTKKKTKNTLHRIVNITKMAMRKSRKSIEIPEIEIDYKSLLTLNNKQ